MNYEELYRLLDKSSHLLFFLTTDFFKPPVYVNRACELITGYSKEEFYSSLSPYKIIHPTDREEAARRFSSTERPFEYTFKLLCKNGDVKWVRCAFGRMRYGDGLVLAGIGVEVTSLVGTKETLRTVVELMDEGVVVMDRDLRILMVNEPLRRIAAPQYSIEEVIGRKCYEVVYSRSAPCEDCPTVRAIESCSSQVKVVHVGRDKRERWFEVKSKPILDETGYVMGVVEYVRDITHQKLREKNIMREERIKTLERVSGGIAHDFNNILAVIMAASSTLRMSLRDPSQLAQVEAIEQACAKARDLVRQFLSFSDHHVPQKRRVNLKKLLEETVRILAYGLSFAVELDAEDAEVEVDPVQFSRVFQNLIINAIEAVEEKGEGDVKVVLKRVDGGVRIEVRDTGVGMDERTMKRIFEPFFTTKSGGTGMGLFVAKSILKSHGATLTVDSKPGEGTTFSVFLPDQGTSKALKTVLVMDDTMSLRQVVKLYLEGKGHHVLEASCGEELLELLKAKPQVDVFLLDAVVESGMGAFEVVDEIRERYPEALLILTSGFVDAELERRAKEKGFHMVLPKPFTMAQLEEAIG